MGEIPIGSPAEGKKSEKIQEVLKWAKELRNNLPSFFGLILQICGQFITEDEFKEYKNIVTNHERLGNILKNAKNLHIKLADFCEAELIIKPKCLQSKLSTVCLTNKSELALKFKHPDEVMEILMSHGAEVALTEHNQLIGVVFISKSIHKYPWCKDSLTVTKAGVDVFTRMRSRQLSAGPESVRAMFVSFEFLRSAVIEKLKAYASESDDDDITVNLKEDPKVIVSKSFVSACARYEELKKERFTLAVNYMLGLAKENLGESREVSSIKCDQCGFTAKTKRGLTQHIKKCKKK